MTWPIPAAVALRASSARTAFWESRRPWWVNKNCVARPVRGWGSGRTVLRVAAMRSTSADGFVVEGNHAFGVEFAERNFEPGAVPGDLVNAVELEIQQFTDAQPDCSGEEQCVGGEAVVGCFERCWRGGGRRRRAGSAATVSGVEGGRIGRSAVVAARRSSPIR